MVLGNFTTKLTHIDNDAPRWLSVFWAIAIGLLTLAMLMTNGITALQNATIIMGLPFSFVMFLVMAGLYKSLRLEDYRHASRSMNAAPVVGNVDILNWKQRLTRVMHHPGTTETRRMLDTVCKPAVQAVADELIKQGMNVDVQQTPLEDEEALYHLDITIHLKKSKTSFIRFGLSVIARLTLVSV